MKLLVRYKDASHISDDMDKFVTSMDGEKLGSFDSLHELPHSVMLLTPTKNMQCLRKSDISSITISFD